MNEIAPEYKTEEIIITKRNLNNFVLMEERRHIRSSQVDKIRVSLERGIHFDSPFVLNEKDGKYVIIDGNHRLKAIEDLFKKNPDFGRIRIKAAVYKKLTPTQEKDIYTKWSLGIKQTIDDLLNLRKSEINLWKALNSKFGYNVSVYADRKTSRSIKFRTIIHMLYATIGTEESTGSEDMRSPQRDNIISVANSYGEDEVVILNDFFRLFTESLGDIRGNEYTTSTFLVPAFNVFYSNYNLLGHEEMVKRFKKLHGDQTILTWNRSTSQEARYQIKLQILRLVNKGRRQEDRLVA